MQDYYELLQVRRSASLEVIRAAWLSLMKQHHPDEHTSHQDAAERMCEAMNTAYETLRDPERRRRYDETLDARAPASPPASYAGTWENSPSSGWGQFIAGAGLVLLVLYNIGRMATPIFDEDPTGMAMIIGAIVGIVLAIAVTVWIESRNTNDKDKDS
jgi:hypothetical protein